MVDFIDNYMCWSHILIMTLLSDFNLLFAYSGVTEADEYSSTNAVS